MVVYLTFSTSLNTLMKFCRRTSANSFSVQFLVSSSRTRAGYFDTSSKPLGKLMKIFYYFKLYFWPSHSNVDGLFDQNFCGNEPNEYGLYVSV